MMMRKITALAIAAALSATALPAAAQEILDRYYTWLGAVDMTNSRGVRLTTLGQILQQDRANYHRFGRANRDDQGDRFFADRDMRARIPTLFDNGPGETLIEEIVLQGNALEVLVFICGRGQTPRYIVVDFADGDTYRGC